MRLVKEFIDYLQTLTVYDVLAIIGAFLLVMYCVHTGDNAYGPNW